MRRRDFIQGVAISSVWPLTAPEVEADRVVAAAKTVGQQVHIIEASSEDDIQRAFETFANDRREFAAAGGLISYDTQFVDVFRQPGIYVARVLKGAKPADLPVLEPIKFEPVINIKTATALDLKVPWQLQQLADEVIE